jgi:hypothetical protein
VDGVDNSKRGGHEHMQRLGFKFEFGKGAVGAIGVTSTTWWWSGFVGDRCLNQHSIYCLEP